MAARPSRDGVHSRTATILEAAFHRKVNWLFPSRPRPGETFDAAGLYAAHKRLWHPASAVENGTFLVSTQVTTRAGFRTTYGRALIAAGALPGS